jgi:death-on-curing protein
MGDTVFLSVAQVKQIHHRVTQGTADESPGVKDEGDLESSVREPRQTFAGQELHSSLVAKAAILGFSMVKNHPFHDGVKRTAHASVETFLRLNGHEIDAPVEEQFEMMNGLAESGPPEKEEFREWLSEKIVPKKAE